MRKSILFLFAAIAVLLVFPACGDAFQTPSVPAFSPLEEASPTAVTVPILMFHDVKTTEGGTWSMSAENFRNTLLFLLDCGYTPVFLDDLVNFVDGTAPLPAKPVVITLDDGYFSNYRSVLPIITELKVPVTIFMTCGTVREEGTIPCTNEQILYKMSMAELTIAQASPYVKIQSHTYALHGTNTSYSSTERDNSLPLKGENESEYKEIFSADCALAEEILRKIGSPASLAFSYPSGKHHSWTEEILRERGYRVSLTTDYSHRNRVVRGEPDSLHLLGRMNVNDETTEAALLRYLERE